MTYTTTSVIARCIADYGIDPTVLYCQVTGKPFGFISMDEIETILSLCEGADEEDLAAELWTRCIASMRPSPSWNLIRPDSLRKMLDRESTKMDLLAYLMNRLYAPIDHKLTLDSRLGILTQNVRQNTKIWTIQFESDDLDQLLCILLEIDTKFGLKNYNRPEIIQAFDWALNTKSDHKALIRQLQAWFDSMMEQFLKMEKKALDTSRMTSNANSSTRTALVETLKKAKPTKTHIVKEAKRKERDMFDDILDSIAGDGDFDSVVTPIKKTPVAAPVAPVRRTRFGVKG